MEKYGKWNHPPDQKGGGALPEKGLDNKCPPRFLRIFSMYLKFISNTYTILTSWGWAELPQAETVRLQLQAKGSLQN